MMEKNEKWLLIPYVHKQFTTQNEKKLSINLHKITSKHLGASISDDEIKNSITK